MIDIIDHGEWVKYTPTDYPIKLPPNIIYAQRVSDGADWYQFRHNLTGTESIKALLRKAEQGWVVITTTHDASELFPADSRLIEISGVTAAHESLRLNLVDLDRRQFTPPPPPEDRPDMMKLIMGELGLDETKMREKLEAAMKSRR